MKVKELIRLLGKQDPELEVVQFCPYEYEHELITEVEYVEPKNLHINIHVWGREDASKVKRGAIQIS